VPLDVVDPPGMPGRLTRLREALQRWRAPSENQNPRTLAFSIVFADGCATPCRSRARPIRHRAAAEPSNDAADVPIASARRAGTSVRTSDHCLLVSQRLPHAIRGLDPLRKRLFVPCFGLLEQWCRQGFRQRNVRAAFRASNRHVGHGRITERSVDATRRQSVKHSACSRKWRRRKEMPI